jgi:hypothetical protein
LNNILEYSVRKTITMKPIEILHGVKIGLGFSVQYDRVAIYRAIIYVRDNLKLRSRHNCNIYRKKEKYEQVPNEQKIVKVIKTGTAVRSLLYGIFCGSSNREFLQPKIIFNIK